MEAFLAANADQFSSMAMHVGQREEVYARIQTGTHGSDTGLFGIDASGAAVFARDASAREAVSVFAHKWVFATKEDAAAAVRADAGLCDAVAGLIDALECDVQSNGETTADYVIRNLFRVAFEFDAEVADGGSRKLSAVSFDPFAPALLPFSDEPHLQASVFIDATTGKSYTLLWPHVDASVDIDDTDDFEVPLLTPVTRGQLTVMPDYSNDAYWIHHYATSKRDSTFDWYLPWSSGLSSLLKGLVPTPSTGAGRFISVLDVGCGNSATVGDGILADGLADMVLHFDVSKEAVHSLAATQQTNRSSSSTTTAQHQQGGIQEHVVFDAALEQGMPFRTASSEGRKPFDWAFDKGTTDGMLSHGVDFVRQVWKNMARVTDTIILVSFGKPQSRIPLIEEEIKNGWIVDQCLEVDGLGTGWSYFLYVCKNVSK